MENVEYSIEPNGPIALYNARAQRLSSVARNRGIKLDGLTKNAAYEARAELSQFVDFPLRIRGSAPGMEPWPRRASSTEHPRKIVQKSTRPTCIGTRVAPL